MSPTQKPTPEEKLFAVIQGAKQPSPRARAQPLSLGLLGAQLLALQRATDLPRINQALLLALIPLGLWCLISPFVMRPRIDRLLGQAAQHVDPFLIAPPGEGLRSSADYVQTMTKQDPFRIQGDTPSDGSTVSSHATPVPPATAQMLLSDFRLVGIAQGEVPTVMIEEVHANQTHILHVGDVIGQLTVKEILDDRVVLQHGSQTLELF